ncbi:hypothetical protein AHA02nite_21040 [Alkalibacillus haloalkaliphilus]|uniref:Uncharacterized protein n=1 Tax=Alkalibacillus haloalkaliphilus TaxID=94136 RepID=A0A511W7M2_9BACI|nr:hypothetical protein AHA02nite_21040 [Alkalibacillus haloalkaliphilus]
MGMKFKGKEKRTRSRFTEFLLTSIDVLLVIPRLIIALVRSIF